MTKPIESSDLVGAQPLNTPAPLAELVLVRHGRPALSRKKSISAHDYIAWWAAYGESSLAEGQTPPAALLEVAARADYIISSPLPRAHETAQALAGGKEIQLNPIFVEAPLPSPPIPFIKLKPGTWGVFSRIFWWMGYSAEGESRRHAELRAIEAADHLIELAQNRTLVILCAHGWFNRMIRRVLRERGWKNTYDGRDDYWSRRHFKAP